MFVARLVSVVLREVHYGYDRAAWHLLFHCRPVIVQEFCVVVMCNELGPIRPHLGNKLGDRNGVCCAEVLFHLCNAMSINVLNFGVLFVLYANCFAFIRSWVTQLVIAQAARCVREPLAILAV